MKYGAYRERGAINNFSLAQPQHSYASTRTFPRIINNKGESTGDTSLSNLSRKELRSYDQLRRLNENDRITRRIEQLSNELLQLTRIPVRW